MRPLFVLLPTIIFSLFGGFVFANEAAENHDDAVEAFRAPSQPDWAANEKVLLRSLKGESKVAGALEVLGSAEAHRARQALSQENLKHFNLYIEGDQVRQRVGTNKSIQDPRVVGIKSVNGFLALELEGSDATEILGLVDRVSNTRVAPRLPTSKKGVEKPGSEFLRTNPDKNDESQDLIGSSEERRN